MLPRFSAFLIWALVSATLLFWGLRLFARAPAAPIYAVAVDDSAAVRGDLTRLFGAAPTASAGPAPVASETSPRFKLLGIMAPRAGAADRQGVALIAVDGKPARAFTVGTYLDDQLVLQSVSLRAAAIGPARGQSAVVLQMPPLVSAATGSLPAVGGGGVPVPQARFVPAAQPPSFPVQGIPGQGAPNPSGLNQGSPPQGFSGQATGAPPAQIRANQPPATD